MIRWLINLLFPRPLPLPIPAPAPVEAKSRNRSAPDEYWENRWSH